MSIARKRRRFRTWENWSRKHGHHYRATYAAPSCFDPKQLGYTRAVDALLRVTKRWPWRNPYQIIPLNPSNPSKYQQFTYRSATRGVSDNPFIRPIPDKPTAPPIPPIPEIPLETDICHACTRIPRNTHLCRHSTTFQHEHDKPVSGGRLGRLAQSCRKGIKLPIHLIRAILHR